MKDNRKFYLYIAECSDGSYYTGITHDLNTRLDQHNRGVGAVYTEEHGPVDLVYFVEYPNRSQVFKRELEIKQFTHNQKKDLIDNFFPIE